MNDNENLIGNFYAALQNLDYQTMQQSYHRDAVFEDPAFGELDCRQVRGMWKMLCLNAKELKVSAKNITANQNTGSCDVIATYLFSQTGRKVENHIHANFRFKEGKIIEHRDHFSLWKWSRQALGLPGYLLGWSPFFKQKIQQKARSRLKNFLINETL